MQSKIIMTTTDVLQFIYLFIFFTVLFFILSFLFYFFLIYRSYDIDSEFLSKIRLLYENLKPRILIRNRFRKALELVDVNDVISCVVCVARAAGMDLSDSCDFPRWSPGKSTRRNQGKSLKKVFDIDDVRHLEGEIDEQDSMNLR